MAYRWNLLPEVATAIEHARPGAGPAGLDELLEAIAEGLDGDLRCFVMRCAQCMSACMRGARRGGAPSETLFDEHLAALKRLSRATTHAQARRQVRAYLRRLAEQVQPARRTRMERAVAGMLVDMRERLHAPRSLARYGLELEISVSHLSRAFARIAGRPFREEQARLRDEAARELLTGTRLPLAEVARRIGLASASHFIAWFKAAHGQTPAQHRRRFGRR